MKENYTCYACGYSGSLLYFPVVYGELGANVGICRTCSRKGILVSTNKSACQDEKYIITAPYGEDGFIKDIEKMFDILNKIVASEEAKEVVQYYFQSFKLMFRIHRYKLYHINPPRKEEFENG